MFLTPQYEISEETTLQFRRVAPTSALAHISPGLFGLWNWAVLVCPSRKCRPTNKH